jgi:hypothetical protein
MKSTSQIISRLALLGFITFGGIAPRPAVAADRYVNVNNPSPSAPYTGWATAATVIQDAIDAAGAGDTIWVTNGTYASGGRSFLSTATNRVVIDLPVTVQSVNGPQFTTIQGQRGFASAIRCVYMTNGAVLNGFTLKNGSTLNTGDWFRDQCGGGVFCESTAVIVSNCVITASAAAGEGGGVFSGTLNNCTLSGNSASQGGGACSAILNSCALNGNSATWGGGAEYGALNNCSLSGNSAQDPGGSRTGEGGGTYSSSVTNCTAIGNHARVSGGGAAWGTWVNGVLANNSALQGGGASASSLVNCTVVGHSAPTDGQSGGGVGGGLLGGSAINCIIISNTSTFGGFNFSGANLSFSCTSPDPGGTSNIVADPQFVDYSGGNYRLQAGSPCINTGTNIFGPTDTDLDGAPRVVDGAVDMGAYEFQHAPFVVGNPASQSVVLTSNATFTISAEGDQPLAYQWWSNGSALADGGRISGANSNSLSIANAQTNDAGNYWVVVSNSSSMATSSVAALTVLLPVTISTQPTNKMVMAGGGASLTVVASGLSSLSYFWYSNNVPLANGGRVSGANAATLNISNAQTNDSGSYYVIIANSYGSLTSSVAALTVIAPVQIVGQSASQAALTGSNATFAVSATGTGPLGYSWFFNGTLLSDNGHINGSATSGLTISNIQSDDAGGYVAIVTNILSAATSHVASLTPQSVIAQSARYVNVSNTAPLAPYLNWTNAATNIQDAIDASVAGDLILVSNGTYNTGNRAVYGATNRVVVDKAVTVQSVNGAAMTIIAGSAVGGIARVSGRCVYLTNGATLTGFTLTNGSTAGTNKVESVQQLNGGGIWCEDASCLVSNCVITGNQALGIGSGGGAFRGTLVNCLLTNNSSDSGGGASSNILINCTLIKNSGFFQGITNGGGAFGSSLSNCLLVANSSYGGGGGAAFSFLTGCVLSNNIGSQGGGVCMGTATDCLISSNRAFNSGGGAYSNILNNCVLKNNLSSGSGGGAFGSVLVNCTVFTNSVVLTAGTGGGIYGGSASNSIVYYNVCPIANNFLSTMPMYYCCVPTAATNGAGNITNPPAFVDLGNEDLHLQSTSPCINSGNNLAVSVTNDFDGNPRIVGGTVDIGAYEFQTPTSVLSYAWAQQYGLPTDSSADNLDSDGDGLSNWQEWIAGTDPTNPLSCLTLLPPAPATNSGGMTVTWASVSGVPYYLQRSSDLASQSPFSTILSNIIGQAGTTTYTDTNAVGNGPFFYRVGVQH